MRQPQTAPLKERYDRQTTASFSSGRSTLKLLAQNLSSTAPELALEALNANFACTPRV